MGEYIGNYHRSFKGRRQGVATIAHIMLWDIVYYLQKVPFPASNTKKQNSVP